MSKIFETGLRKQSAQSTIDRPTTCADCGQEYIFADDRYGACDCGFFEVYVETGGAPPPPVRYWFNYRFTYENGVTGNGSDVAEVTEAAFAALIRCRSRNEA